MIIGSERETIIRTVSIFRKDFDYVECLNEFKEGFLYKVTNNSCYSYMFQKTLMSRICVGVWQPKGAKLKRDAEKI